MIEATPWGHHPTSLIHDRDRVYGADFATRITGLGIQSIRTPVRSPLANAHRGAGCANPTPGVPGSHLPLSERYVRSLLAEFVAYYNQDRAHRSLALEIPVAPRRPVDGEVAPPAYPRRSAPRPRTTCLTLIRLFAALQAQAAAGRAAPPRRHGAGGNLSSGLARSLAADSLFELEMQPGPEASPAIASSPPLSVGRYWGWLDDRFCPADHRSRFRGSSFSEVRAELVGLPGAAPAVDPDRPRRMDLSPILSRPSLVENAMEDVLVDDVRSGHRDVVSWRRCGRRDEAAGVGVVIHEDKALLVLGDDLHN